MVGWYIGEMEGDIESEAELLEKRTVIEKVIDRLVQHVSIGFYNMIDTVKWVIFVGLYFRYINDLLSDGERIQHPTNY